MAGSRIEKLGTIFSRVNGLLRAGALKEADKPLWYDVYAAFPPKIEPKYDRYVEEKAPINIFYKEDAIRAKFYNTFGNPDVINMRQSHSVCCSEKFIQKYTELEVQFRDKNEGELFAAATEQLKSEGIVLKTLKEIEKEKKLQRKAKESRSKSSTESNDANVSPEHRLQQLTEHQEPKDFIYDETLARDLEQK